MRQPPIVYSGALRYALNAMHSALPPVLVLKNHYLFVKLPYANYS